MKPAPDPLRTISPARRARIVQRVLVDGWTSAEAAAAFDVSKRQVDVWVAGFRRSGMASLRGTPGKILAARIIRLTVLLPLRAIFSRIARNLHPLSMRKHPPQPLPLQRLGDKRRSRD
jgi:transposase-like protein